MRNGFAAGVMVIGVSSLDVQRASKIARCPFVLPSWTTRSITSRGWQRKYFAAAASAAFVPAANQAAVMAAEAMLARIVSHRGEIGDDLAADAFVPRAPDQSGGAGDGMGSGGPTMGTVSKEDDERRRRLAAEDLFVFETERMRAEAEGDHERVRRLRDYIRFKQLELQMEASSAELLQDRLDAEDELERIKLRREDEERAMASRLGALEIERANIEADRYATAEEKRRRLLPLLQEEARLLAARIKALEREAELETDPSARGRIRDKIDDLRSQQADNQRGQSDAQPRTIFGALEEAAVAMQSRIGTIADQIGAAFSNVADSIRTSLGGALFDLVWRAQSAKDAAVGFATAIAKSFVEAGAQMVADWIMSHVIMENVRRLFNASRVAEEAVATSAEVAIHTGGEAAKTGATAAGTGARKGLAIAETIFHGVQWVARNAIHLAGEVMNTGITMAQQAIRLPLLIVESGVYLAKAAIAAMSAMASIPYVGPFLAIAAMGAILAAGGKLLGGFAEGGIARGPGTGTSDSIVTRVSNGEAITRARVVRRFGEPFFEDLNAGILNLAALPDDIVSGLAAPDYTAATDAESLGGGAGGGRGRSGARFGGGGAESVVERNFILVDSPEAAARAQRKFTDARVAHINRKTMGRRIR